MSKDTRGYNVVRVIGLTGDEDLVDVRVSSNPVETEILELLSPCVTAANELKVKVTGDIVIGDVQVDNVQLVDDEGNELDFTASGAIQNYVNDGWDVAQGATTDTVTAPTVIGNLKALNAKDFATETTLATLGTESSLSAAALSLASIDSKDFASEATLTAAAASLDTIKAIDFATSAKQDSAKTVLDNIAAIDFATETTLTGAAAILTAIKDTDGIKKIVDKVAETVADGDNVALGSTSDTDTATTVIGRLQKLITDLGTLADSKKLSDVITSLGYLTGISAAGAVGTLTATTTATAAIASGSALAARKGLEILNNSANLVYWGYTDGVTTATGLPINPGVAKQFEFKPSVATAIYVIAASDSQLYIHEWK